jgi:hypothetical protein
VDPAREGVRRRARTSNEGRPGGLRMHCGDPISAEQHHPLGGDDPDDLA